MKRIFIISILLIIASFIIANPVNATTPENLANEIFAMGYPYGMTESERVQIDRNVRELGVTQSQADIIMEKAREMKAVLDQYGISNLSYEAKTKIKNIAIEAAAAVDATLVFTSDRTCEIYKNGVKIDTAVLSLPSQPSNGSTETTEATGTTEVTSSRKKLVYTGSNFYIYISLSIIALLCAEIALKKKYEN